MMVYKSRAAHSSVYDYLLINHASKPKILTMVQVTTSDAKSHAIPEGALDDVLNELQLSSASDIKLRFVFANPFSSQHDMQSESHGQLFVAMIDEAMEKAKADAIESLKQAELDFDEKVRAFQDSRIEAKQALPEAREQDAVKRAEDKMRKAKEVEAAAKEQLRKVKEDDKDHIVRWDKYLKKRTGRSMERLLKEMEIYFVNFPDTPDVVDEQR